jgi:hypothetical protein
MRPLAARLRALAATSDCVAATTKNAEVQQAFSSFSQRTRQKAEMVELLERA